MEQFRWSPRHSFCSVSAQVIDALFWISWFCSQFSMAVRLDSSFYWPVHTSAGSWSSREYRTIWRSDWTCETCKSDSGTVEAEPLWFRFHETLLSLTEQTKRDSHVIGKVSDYDWNQWNRILEHFQLFHFLNTTSRSISWQQNDAYWQYQCVTSKVNVSAIDSYFFRMKVTLSTNDLLPLDVLIKFECSIRVKLL